ncbi:Gfo/Idh/MocA family oxidoreductase [Porticoccaceae bacterium]|nr:Gfo/Idh/MocA family oxidoreductase [Porticoccaceae bacterium]MDB2593740.1 Gfo/Idh/MocA family oxidoreductase [Porticoccaceae bacterium]
MKMERRKFIGLSAATFGALAFSASSYARILGANDRINVGFMGTKSRGMGLLGSFAKMQGVNLTHNCDVDSRVLEETHNAIIRAGFEPPKSDKDIRRILEDPTLDALVIAAPDHWHATAGVMALEAGKHVYVEKPLSHNPHEGEIFIFAQNKYKQIVQMGNQQRSSVESIELMMLIEEGILGDIYRAETWYGNNRGSIGNGNSMPPPSWLDWDLWQGPAPRRPYKDIYVHYNWHWFWHWGTGEICNNAAHELDIARWAMDVDFPEKVSVTAGRNFYVKDDWEMYDTMEVRYDFPGNKTIEWVGNSCNKVNRFGRGRGTLLLGTNGHAIVDRAGYEIYSTDGVLLRERKAQYRSVNTTDLIGAGALTDAHVNNFLESIRGVAKQQHSPITDGHLSTLLCHLGNIAYRVGKDIYCDPSNGRVKGAEANRFWQRDFQDGWNLSM